MKHKLFSTDKIKLQPDMSLVTRRCMCVSDGCFVAAWILSLSSMIPNNTDSCQTSRLRRNRSNLVVWRKSIFEVISCDAMRRNKMEKCNESRAGHNSILQKLYSKASCTSRSFIIQSTEYTHSHVIVSTHRTSLFCKRSQLRITVYRLSWVNLAGNSVFHSCISSALERIICVNIE